MKKVTALFVATVMLISLLPAVVVTAEGTEDIISMLGGKVLWSAPQGEFDGTPVEDAFEGWSAAVTSGSVDLKTTDMGSTLCYYNPTYAQSDNVTEVVSPGYGSGSGRIIIRWLMYHDTANDLYFDFSFRDVNNTEIAFLKLDKNAVDVGYSHPNSNTDYYAMGYPDTGVECAIAAYNNADGMTHTAEYYVAGELVTVFEELEGVIDGFGSVVSSNGLWSRANKVIGFTDFTIGCVGEAEEADKWTASYRDSVYMINGTRPSLPVKGVFADTDGTVEECTIVWNEPESYAVGENTVTGTARATIKGITVTKEVSLTAVCYPETFTLNDMSGSRSGDVTAYFDEALYGEFFFEFDFNMTNLVNCWVYLSQDGGLWGNGQIGLGTPNDSTGIFKTTVSGGTSDAGTSVVTNKTYHIFIKGDASRDKYSLTMTDSDTGEIIVTVTDRDFRRSSDYINSIRLSVNGARGTFTVKNIRCYAKELMEAPTEEESTEPATEPVTEEATESVTEEPTEEVTEPATETPTEEATESVTETPTEEATQKPTRYDVIEDAFVQNDKIYGINRTNTNGLMIASYPDENRGPEYDANGETTYLKGSSPTTLGSTRVGLVKFPVIDIEKNERATMKLYVRNWHNQGFDGGNTFLRVAATPLKSSGWADKSEGSTLYILTEPLLDNWATPVFSQKAEKKAGYIEFDVTEIMHAAKNADMEYISFKLQIYWGAAYCVEREAAVSGGSYEGLSAYIELKEESLKHVTVSGDATLTKNGAAMNGFAYVSDSDDVRLQLEDAQIIGAEEGCYVPNEKLTFTADTEIKDTFSMGFGLTMVDGAQVRYGGGVDENGNVGSGNGLRFITLVDKADTLAGMEEAELGVIISAEDSDSTITIKAEKWQNDTTFTSALTNLSVSNYNRRYTATPYAKVGEKTFTGESVTRSIYQVASGLLIKEDPDYSEEDTMLLTVLNAYVNQVGIRLVFSDNAEFTDWELRANTNSKGAYTGECFFEVGETEVDGKVYSVKLTPIGNNTVIRTENGYWNEYIRINNNNSQTKLCTTLTDNRDGTYTLSFDTGKLNMGTYPEEKIRAMKPTYEKAVAAMEKANSYWQKNNSYTDWYGGAHPAFWDKAAYHTGNVEMYRVTGNEEYLQYTIDWANYNNWMGNNSTSDPSTWTWGYNQNQGSNAVLFGDWQTCFQVYLDLYDLGIEGAKIDRVKEVMDYQVSKENDDFWWWADALYMVMPVMSKLYKETGDEKYLDALYKYFRYAKELMYDGPGGIPESKDGYTTSASLRSGASYSDPDDYKYLFFRDAGYVYPLNPNPGHADEKNFWARGNGWVFAGLIRVLEDMPESYEHYDEFYNTYIEMAEAIVSCQMVDDKGYGFWTQSMLQDYPKGTNGNDEGYETSGTAFFAYGLFKGINSGILTDTKYELAAIRTWGYLEKVALHESGKVGYVQPIGSNATQATSYDTTVNFGVGAYLLAASEAALWAKNQ